MMKNDFKDTLNFILEEMKMVYKNDNRPWIIGYSGGKDSTVVVQLAFKMLESLPEEERHKHIYIVSSDTLIENPIVLGYLQANYNAINEYVKDTSLPISSHMVYPKYNNTFWTNIIGKGLPTPTSIRFRWCTERLKIQPSNDFIETKVKESGEVVLLLGVRKTESIARKNRIEKREIEGYLFTPHNTINNTYVYNPIVELTTDEVWKILLSDNGVTPWGTNNNDLQDLYMGSDGGECPFTITKNAKGQVDTPSCGNSRFGCWSCTVVKEDKSLTGFIKNGEEWLQPLLDFRNWLLSIRDKHEYRRQYRRDGNHYYKKLLLDDLPINYNLELNKNYIFNEGNKEYIDLRNSANDIQEGSKESSDKEKIYLELLPLIDNYKIDPSKVFESDKGSYINVLGYGPFNFKARKEILQKLLETQKEMDKYIDFPLITIQELEVIDKIWDDEEDLTCRSLVDIYYNILRKKLPWHDFKKPIFDDETLFNIKDLNKQFNLPDNLISTLLIETNKNKHFTNKTVLDKSISKILNQKHLHKSIVEEIENDN
ncbi:DNA phosphorothioation system sulfurtransferase DndC [Tepidibacter aestuarii]|uniref:DNA phosphorothioation system sulfurtransferase DndC n=1 Tax=Tepidibacter aestuarii TaxID=2925782 RepID=UPI0020C079CC|nr:DNA phosphorothioation system sulfurtransferase DndC [Tepidibacter aestuarii]CAH2213359.1 DNA sulfur modification protein DndC [Tepidibacter aestuarii]